MHYRHVATSIARQLLIGESIFKIALTRARGYTCSSLDPITGGKHCAIGGSSYDYIVTSTLASQATPAVGRALAVALSNILLSTRTSNDFRPSPSLFSSSSTQRLESESDLELDFNSADKSFAPIPNIVKDGEIHFQVKESPADIKFPKDSISYVSFGDGSVNNSHFLSALNLAKYSQHRGIKVRA